MCRSGFGITAFSTVLSVNTVYAFRIDLVVDNPPHCTHTADRQWVCVVLFSLQSKCSFHTPSWPTHMVLCKHLTCNLLKESNRDRRFSHVWSHAGERYRYNIRNKCYKIHEIVLLEKHLFGFKYKLKKSSSQRIIFTVLLGFFATQYTF